MRVCEIILIKKGGSKGVFILIVVKIDNMFGNFIFEVELMCGYY